jgi:hypothetical protein
MFAEVLVSICISGAISQKEAKLTTLNNSCVAELLALEAENASHFVQRALRRASRRAFLWDEEATELVEQNRSLTELSGVGPYIEKIMMRWIEDPPRVPKPPAIRRDFLTIPQARAELAKKSAWLGELKGDLQMHTQWSDGWGSVREMVEAGEQRGYEYVSITDHSKGLAIAGGIDEKQLVQQAEEIDSVNRTTTNAGKKTRALRSIELNLNPQGEGDMDRRSETQLVKAPPKMAKAANSDGLRSGFEKHLKQTEGHVSRLEFDFPGYDEKPRAKSVKAWKA